MENIKDMELQLMSSAQNTSDEHILLEFESSGSRSKIKDRDLLVSDVGSNIYPILRTGSKRERPKERKKITWVDQSQNPQPLHIEHPHPRWVIPLGLRGPFSGPTFARIKYIIFGFLSIFLVCVLVYFLARIIFPNNGGGGDHGGTVNVSNFMS
jgi:hypothetical protein